MNTGLWCKGGELAMIPEMESGEDAWWERTESRKKKKKNQKLTLRKSISIDAGR